MAKLLYLGLALVLFASTAFLTTGASLSDETQLAGYAVRGAAPIEEPEFPFDSAATIDELQLAGYAVRGAAPDEGYGPEFPF